MATAVLDEALHIAADPERSLIEAMAAAQAAHQVRHDLIASSELPVVQRQLVAALERLGEPAAALQVASAALGDWPTFARTADRDWLAAAVLRLSTLHLKPEQPLAADLIAEAVAGGASLGLEARIWAVVELLRTGDQREAYLHLADQAATSLDEHAVSLGSSADQWRLLSGLPGWPCQIPRTHRPTTCSAA